MNPCFDALSSLLGCCLNMSLFCPPSPPAPPHFLLQPQSLSLICKCCPPTSLLPLSLTLSQTILDCGGESASLSARRNFLATYIIHVCWLLCVYVGKERVERLKQLLMRITEPTAIKTKQHCQKYHLVPALTSVYSKKTKTKHTFNSGYSASRNQKLTTSFLRFC